MDFDPTTAALRCGFCGAASPVDVPRGEVAYRELQQGLSQTQRGLGAGGGTKSCRCQECGASAVFANGRVKERCAFCGSARVMKEAEDLNALRPFGVLPFRVDRRAAELAFAGWLERLWMRPGDLSRLARTEAVTGIYVPFYLFEAHVESSWTAMAGSHVDIEDPDERDGEGEYTILGGPDLPRHEPERKTYLKKRRVRHTRWQRARGRRADDFRDVRVCVSHGVPNALAERLGTFELGGLLPYDPAYLAGWSAEEAAMDLRGGYDRASGKMLTLAETRCQGDVPGDVHRGLLVSSSVTAVRWRYVLLPVWLLDYRYRHRVYQLVVNGQTGEIVGEAPLSGPKIALLALAMTAFVGLIYYYFGYRFWYCFGPHLGGDTLGG